MPGSGDEGELAIVLHSHMPYVERCGTWPFGEEWLWEAIATSYLPVLELLDAGAALTLSMTPVLCDQLEAPGALDRCREFLATIRVESHRRDIATAAGPGEVAALEHSAARYERARERLEGLDLLGELGRHVAWTSSATHAILPLLATDAGVRLQLRAGIDAHRRRFGEGWRGGLWLPECAYAPWLGELLDEAGVRAACVDFTDVLDDHLTPLRSAAGPLLVPIDRATIELVWSRGGYPAGGAYRSYHDFTPHRHRARAVDGSPYDPARAADAARRDGADFVARTRERVAGGGLAVCALDTELIGDWWHEGPLWLRRGRGRSRAPGPPARAPRRRARAPRAGCGPDRPGRHVVGHAARPVHMERAAGLRHGMERPRRGAAHDRGRCRGRRARRPRAPRAAVKRLGVPRLARPRRTLRPRTRSRPSRRARRGARGTRDAGRSAP